MFSNIYAIVSLLSATLLSNMVALVLLWRRTQLTSMGLLLANVFITITLFTISYFIMFFTVYDIAHSTEVTSTLFLMFTLYFSGVNTVVLNILATHRFIAVYFPIKSRLRLTTGRTKKDIILTWVITTLIFALISVLIIMGVIQKKEVTKYYSVCQLCECFIITVVYFSITIKMSVEKRNSFLNNNNANYYKNRTNNNVRLLVVCILITFTHLVSNIPIGIAAIQNNLYGDSHVWMWMEPIGAPLMYIITTPEFAVIYKKYFRR